MDTDEKLDFLLERHEYLALAMIPEYYGQIWYLIAPLAAAIVPIVVHFVYRTNYFADKDSISMYYKVGWYTVWIGQLIVNAPLFIMQFIAIFGIAKKETIYAWQILHNNVDVFLFICASIFYIVAWFPANLSTNTAMVEAIEIDIMLLWGITALMQSYYQFFYPSWMKAMKLRTLGEWITNPLP